MQTTTVDRATFKDTPGLDRRLGGDNRCGRWRLVALFTKGLWPLTNGWFALLSGISASRATAWVLKKYADVTAQVMLAWLPRRSSS
jgi:hypothetical protein